jgi:hypothetical protein
MQALARTMAARAGGILNLLFHSSEAIVGGSPYNRTPAELTAFLDRLDRFLGFAVERLGATPVTFAEFHARFTARDPASSHAHLPHHAASAP